MDGLLRLRAGELSLDIDHQPHGVWLTKCPAITNRLDLNPPRQPKRKEKWKENKDLYSFILMYNILNQVF